MKFDIFVSYSRKDFALVYPFVEEIKALGIKVWFDITGIESGQESDEIIINAIDNSDTLLFCYSSNSIASEWTKKEVMYAKETDTRVIPVLINGAKPLKGWFKFHFGGIDYIDLTNSIQKEKLFENLKSWYGKNKDKNMPDMEPKSNTHNKVDMVSSPVGAEIHIESDADCDVYDYSKKLNVVVHAFKDAVIVLKKGEHKLRFVSCKEPSVEKKKTLSVPDNDFVGCIEVKLQSEVSKETNRKETELNLYQIIGLCESHICRKKRYYNMEETYAKIDWDKLVAMVNKYYDLDCTFDEYKSQIPLFGEKAQLWESDLLYETGRFITTYQMSLIIEACMINPKKTFTGDNVNWNKLINKIANIYEVKMEKWQLFNSGVKNTADIINNIFEKISGGSDYSKKKYFTKSEFQKLMLK